MQKRISTIRECCGRFRHSYTFQMAHSMDRKAGNLNGSAFGSNFQAILRIRFSEHIFKQFSGPNFSWESHWIAVHASQQREFRAVSHQKRMTRFYVKFLSR
jgi:hypothetical protein